MDLLLTLGHNSSAIGISNNGNIFGYEEERFTRHKSESSFPKNSIVKILVENSAEYINNVYISHWYDNFDFLNEEKYNLKHWDYKFFKNKLKLVTLSKNFTHHDAHAYSVLKYYNDNAKGLSSDGYHIIVADGFGNLQEVVSIYLCKNNIPELVDRFYGYNNSLGLLYQYATSFCGMKEHQDEYKFLGYESKIQSTRHIEILNNISDKAVENMLNSMILSRSPKRENEYINLNDLNSAKSLFINTYNSVLKITETKDYIDHFKKTVIGYFVQAVVEKVMNSIIEKYNIKKLMLSGGLFYNVKLNNQLSKQVDSICVNPLAGDQGASIGLYYKYNPTSKFKYDNLFWGKRYLDCNFSKIQDNKHICYSNNKEIFADIIVAKLRNNEIVNVVCGNMEFGPRALCHTSTLALPTSENVYIINQLNCRDTVMPMAPVILAEDKDYFFRQYNNIIGSDKHMIIACDYNHDIDCKNNLYNGIVHNYPYPNDFIYSGRPQIIYDNNHYIYSVLKKLDIKALINTSFNVHGKPVVFSIDQALDDFNFQLKQKEINNIKKPVNLVIGDF